jgi:hypothetical protein
MTDRRRFRLVPDDVSRETVACLRELLHDAERGELIGIGFAALYRGKECIVNAAGESYKSPLFMQGPVNMLLNYFVRLAYGEQLRK